MESYPCGCRYWPGNDERDLCDHHAALEAARRRTDGTAPEEPPAWVDESCQCRYVGLLAVKVTCAQCLAEARRTDA